MELSRALALNPTDPLALQLQRDLQ
jgi:hypothetical protein